MGLGGLWEVVVVVVVDVVVVFVVVVVVELVLVEALEHDSLTATTGSFTGSLMADSGVPGGTFTVNVCFPPPASVTVITHVSAEADGITVRPRMTSSALARPAKRLSIRVLNTVVLLLPMFAKRTKRFPRPHAA